MLFGLLIRFRWFVAVAILAVLILVESIVVYNGSREIREFRNKALQFESDSSAFLSAVGYGGLIHHFKNCVLRGASPEFCDRAEAKAAEALAIVDDLTAGAAALQLSEDFAEMRRMVEVYGANARVVRNMHAEGRSIAEIDTAVRFDDAEASQQIDRTLQQSRIEVERSLAAVSERFRFVLALLVVTASGALIGGGLLVYSDKLERLRLEAASAEELSEANQRLREANAALDQFASLASHDLKSPLRHMNMIAEMMAEDADSPEKIRQYSELIQKTVVTMRALVEGLLSFAQTGFNRPEIERFDAETMVAEVVEELTASAPGQNAEVDVGPMPSLNADPRLLKRAFQNILENAFKYVDEGVTPKVRLRAEQDERLVRFVFEDNGIGVPQEAARAIFEPLKRAHATDTVYPGSGLGLALVRWIALAHGGDVWVDTDYTNGARFVLEVPRSALTS